MNKNNTTNQNANADIIALATEKINKEFKEFSGGQKERAVSSYVSSIIQDFCKQDTKFAEVVYRYKRTLSDCCEAAVKGCSTHISDIDVYRNAVQFYFPDSQIEMTMKIHTGVAPSDEDIQKEPKDREKTVAKTENNPKIEKQKEEPKKAVKEVKKEPKKQETIQLSLF